MLRTSFLVIAVSAIFANATVSVAAEDSANTYQLEIASQPVVSALKELSRQTGLQISYLEDARVDDPAGLVTSEIRGSLTPQAALEAMLKPTSLIFSFVNARTIAIFKPRPQSTTHTWVNQGSKEGSSFSAKQPAFALRT